MVVDALSLAWYFDHARAISVPERGAATPQQLGSLTI